MSVPPETCWVGPFLNSPLSLKYICALRRAHRPALLEAFPAKYRPPLRGTERNRRFLPALRAVGLCFRAHRRCVTSAAATAALGAFGLATFAALRFVFEAFVSEEHLFAGGKNEFSATFRTLQHLVVVFHEPLSPGPVWGRRLGGLCTWEPRCLRRPVSGDAGRGSLGLAGTKLRHDPKHSALRGPDSRKCGAEPRRKRTDGPDRVGTAPELNPLPVAASCAVASAKALPWPGASRRVSYRSYAS